MHLISISKCILKKSFATSSSSNTFATNYAHERVDLSSEKQMIFFSVISTEISQIFGLILQVGQTNDQVAHFYYHITLHNWTYVRSVLLVDGTLSGTLFHRAIELYFSSD